MKQKTTTSPPSSCDSSSYDGSSYSNSSDSSSSSGSCSSSSSDSDKETEDECAPTNTWPITPASPDAHQGHNVSSSSDSFCTAGDRTPEAEEEVEDLLDLIPIDIPDKLTFKPKPRTIIKDPRLLGYQNLDFNFAKEWERLYSNTYVTPVIPLVPSRNYSAVFDPRQYTKALKRTLTAELVTGRKKQTLDLMKIMTCMNDTHMKVTHTADMKHASSNSSSAANPGY